MEVWLGWSQGGRRRRRRRRGGGEKKEEGGEKEEVEGEEERWGWIQDLLFIIELIYLMVHQVGESELL